MAEVNENMFVSSLEVLDFPAVTVPAYDTAVVPVYSSYFRLPSSPDISVGTMFKATSAGTIACKIELEQSNDATTWAVPADVAALESSWAGAGLLIRNVSPDVTKYARFKLSGLATHAADAVFTIVANIAA